MFSVKPEGGAGFPVVPTVEGKAEVAIVLQAEHVQLLKMAQVRRWNWLASRPMFWKGGMFWKADPLPDHVPTQKRSRSIWDVLWRGR